MTFQELQKANASIKTTPITKVNKKTGEAKTTQYAEVNERIMAFRKLYPNGAIVPEIVSLVSAPAVPPADNGSIVTMKASVYDDNNKLIAVGHAQEKESSTFINQTSFIENCETSAVGRALGFLGIGIESSIASYEEVQNAINNQNKNQKSSDVHNDGSFIPHCKCCNKEITVAEHDYSVKKWKKPLCRECQKKQ